MTSRLLVVGGGIADFGAGTGRLAVAGRLGEVLATVGGVVTMAGLVLLVQNATDRFGTWAYAWTLVFLVGAGLGRWLVGVVRGRGEPAAGGAWLVGFLVLAVARLQVVANEAPYHLLGHDLHAPPLPREQLILGEGGGDDEAVVEGVSAGRLGVG